MGGFRQLVVTFPNFTPKIAGSSPLRPKNGFPPAPLFRAGLPRRSDLARQAEVRQLHRVAADQQILGLHVAVKVAMLVHVIHRLNFKVQWRTSAKFSEMTINGGKNMYWMRVVFFVDEEDRKTVVDLPVPWDFPGYGCTHRCSEFPHTQSYVYHLPTIEVKHTYNSIKCPNVRPASTTRRKIAQLLPMMHLYPRLKMTSICACIVWNMIFRTLLSGIARTWCCQADQQICGEDTMEHEFL